MEINRFEIEFVERTRRVLAEYQGEYKLTNLLNCLVGLVILPHETIQRDAMHIWDINIENSPIYPDLQINIFEPISHKDKDTNKLVPDKKTLGVFLRKLRNGIAHQNIEHINENGLFVGVIFRNRFAKMIDFEVKFRRPGLEKFANFIAEQYLHHIRPEARGQVAREELH